MIYNISNDEITAEINLPGFSKEEVRMQFDRDKYLVISAESNRWIKVRKELFRYVVSPVFDWKNANASLVDGVLTIKAKKKIEAENRILIS